MFMIDMSVDVPPFTDHCGALLSAAGRRPDREVEECREVPLIDVSGLWSGDGEERGRCVASIAGAASEWGFFQVLNHGIGKELLGDMRRKQEELFNLPFEKKSTCGALHDYYKWGGPTATSLHQYSWSEAFHVPLSVVSEENLCLRRRQLLDDQFGSLREVMGRLGKAMSKLVQALAEALEENLGQAGGGGLAEKCSKETSFLRLNRYPPCPHSPEVFGLTPHTDSDFLTLLWQDQVGGLQLMNRSKWVVVKPNPDALIVNIGDLFQVWSNDRYKSVEHKVVTNAKSERYSFAYFLCPSYESIIGSCEEPSIYRKFTFGEYTKQVREDVQRCGNKVGLPRFLL